MRKDPTRLLLARPGIPTFLKLHCCQMAENSAKYLKYKKIIYGENWSRTLAEIAEK
jgi:hypothetical protein